MRNEKCNGSTEQYFQIWELFNVEANQQPFQLPPPADFMCLNPFEYGAHPEFYWREFNGSPGFYIFYKIYRSINQGIFHCIASALDRGFWTDKTTQLFFVVSFAFCILPTSINF